MKNSLMMLACRLGLHDYEQIGFCRQGSRVYMLRRCGTCLKRDYELRMLGAKDG